MSNWQERITHETPPAIRAEHELRYRTAAPLIATASCWADLGCGNGIAAAAAIGRRHPQRAALIDLDELTVAAAAAELGIVQATLLTGDLTDVGDLKRIGQALLDAPGSRVVTCFEVVEHLGSFLPLLEWATSMAAQHDCTFLMSVPNDAFWSIENPHHLTCWGDGAFAELCHLLPAERTMLRQVALSGSALLGWDAQPERRALDSALGGERTVASHFLVSFGPRHAEVRRGAMAVQTDMLEQRRWERMRESNLAFAQRRVLEQQQELEQRNTWFEEWRAYIHELERELGKPLSGATRDELPEQGAAADQTGAAQGPAGGEPPA